MGSVLAIFIFLMHVFFATLVSSALMAIIALLLLPGQIGDMAALALLALAPSYFVVVVASAIEQHISLRRPAWSFGRRAFQIAPTFLVLSFLTMFVMFLLMGTFSRLGWYDVLTTLGLISVVITPWAIAYWSTYTLSAPVFEVPPRNPANPNPS